MNIKKSPYVFNGRITKIMTMFWILSRYFLYIIIKSLVTLFLLCCKGRVGVRISYPVCDFNKYWVLSMLNYFPNIGCKRHLWMFGILGLRLGKLWLAQGIICKKYSINSYVTCLLHEWMVTLTCTSNII